MKETVNIGLIGFGTIGSGVVATLNQNLPLLENKVNKKVNLKKIVDLDITTDRGVEVQPGVLSTNVDDILEDEDIDIVIELVGGYQPALSFILKAMENGKHVVTANKALLAKHWDEIITSAQENNVRISFEASVGGGIPLLAPVNDGLAANNIETIYGIINGTANYILTKMAEENLDFDTVLKEAQEMGYAEADPTFDIEGHDTAQKLIILSILGFGVYVEQEKFHVEGITRITPDDIQFARDELDSVIKLLAIAKIEDGELEIRVHPTLVPETHLLASVNDVFNAVYLEGDIVGPVLMYGAGAGMMPTASAVVADCLDIIQDMEKPVAYGPRETRVEKVKDISEVQSKYYLRITALDQPGVIHAISGVLSDLDISIESVSQRKAAEGEAIPIFIVTHHALEKNVQEAIKCIDEMDLVKAETNLIRLLE
ncbi:MAG: homoserine dehydrogenase [Methanobacterium sp.]|uniref:homoserine dehydrogenase n=1 Tax=Methanobacterium sp. TaxID=2164 RepID=UPI0003C96D58|nr:homoserine dehydrogenase [Methanobacterium sp.]MDI3549900.1 homoserine dehydrogenase [Methanobacterium sp.]CDG65866.1 Homoserine dehydrogenase [Methanobacterium sp. MB1]